MKKSAFILICLVFALGSSAQEYLYVHTTGHMALGAPVSATDSLYFSADRSIVFIRCAGKVSGIDVSAIDSISFGPGSATVSVNYSGNAVRIINPLAFEGITVTASGAQVTVNSTNTSQEVTYDLTGNSGNGQFKLYSLHSYRLQLNNLTLTNSNGPAINLQSAKRGAVVLPEGTSSSLTDGPAYAASTEDQKATFFSEGQLVFEGKGSLTVNSLTNHAVCSDDYIEFQNGALTIPSAGKDGMHCNGHFRMTGGSLNITSTGDGIESEEALVSVEGGSITVVNASADVTGIRSDSLLNVSGGSIQLTVKGNQSKGLKSGQKMLLSGGEITIATSGSVYLATSGSGYDPAYCAAIKSDTEVEINGSTITIGATGNGNKGISAATDINILSGTVSITNSGNGATYKNSKGVTDSYNATCLTADRNISILGGSITTSCSGSGGRGINADGTLTIGGVNQSPVLNVTTTGSKFVISGSGQSAEYCEAKAIKCDGEITIHNGTIKIASADDGIKSKTFVTINGGDISVSNSVEGIEAPFITMNNGTVHVQASNDGINTSKGTTNGGTEQNDGRIFSMNGGYLVSGATQGDAVDCNGNIVMTGGTMILHGPPSQPEEAIDFNGTFNMSGGFFIAGSTNSNMTKPMSSTSGQYGLLLKSSSIVSANTIFRIQDNTGKDLVTFKPARNAYYFLFSSPVLKTGTSYSVYTGGSCTGTLQDGLYSGGTYSGGTLRKSFTVSSKVTTLSF
ncbi:MAG TPA: carbohydrate-binding domain-containing protein [Prolixibacteraceae bacterium]|nr:carbohydrate-binding domain-containing protein [Prolixibacteraceae bacterium]